MSADNIDQKVQAFDAALVARAQEMSNCYAEMTGHPYRITIDRNDWPGQFVVFRVGYDDGSHTDTLAFNLTKGQFQKVRWAKKSFTVAKTQPKTPVTLDNYEFRDGSAGLKGISNGLVVILGSTFKGVHSFEAAEGA